MSAGYRYGRVDSSNQYCAGSNFIGEISVCGSNWNGDSILLRILKVIESRLDNHKFDGWEYRRCLNTQAVLEVTKMIERIKSGSMETSSDGTFRWTGVGVSGIDKLWENIKNKYGNLGLPDSLLDHTDPVTGEKLITI